MVQSSRRQSCRHTTLFVIVYVAGLPLAMWPTLGWATVIVAPLTTFLLVRDHGCFRWGARVVELRIYDVLGAGLHTI
jgi:hypothetical protein